MPVVLVYYPNSHLATAVKFNNQNISGDYLIIDGEKYLICDPTYINANLGMAMPNLRNVPVEILMLKNNE
jgi:Cu/Ag efflux pump CusA